MAMFPRLPLVIAAFCPFISLSFVRNVTCIPFEGRGSLKANFLGFWMDLPGFRKCSSWLSLACLYSKSFDDFRSRFRGVSKIKRKCNEKEKRARNRCLALFCSYTFLSLNKGAERTRRIRSDIRVSTFSSQARRS